MFAYMAALMGVFGVLALALSSVGVYGVMAFVVSGQTHEIGIRMALGAQRGTVLAMLSRSTVLYGPHHYVLLSAWRRHPR